MGLATSVQAQHRAAAKRGSKWFFIDNAGTVVINKLYDSVGERFVNGLAPAMLKDKWGYIDVTGKMVIPNKFSQAMAFHDGKALIQKEKKWLIIDTKGKAISTVFADIEEILNVSEGIVLAQSANSTQFYILPGGKILKPNKTYTDLQPFSYGLARVKRNGKFGFIDTSGKEIIACEFDAAASFRDTITSVEVASFYYIINKKGEKIEPLPHVYDVSSFNRGISALYTPLTFTIYRSGGTQTKTELKHTDNKLTTYVYPFSEDVALFWSQGIAGEFRFGYLLENGKLLNPYRYEWARDFSNGLAAVKLNGFYGYINKRGEMVIDAMYDNALSFYPVK